MAFSQSDWDRLKLMREDFLSEKPIPVDYWKSEKDLELYDQTFAERIGWKWNSVLDQFQNRHFTFNLESYRILDWGCGTGVASRQFVAFLQKCGVPFHRINVAFFDRSRLAVDFAIKKFEKEFPEIPAQPFGSSFNLNILLVSHVLGELEEAQFSHLSPLLHKSSLVLFVEPGTRVHSLKLSTLRDRLIKEGWNVIAPCPHQKNCGALLSESDWCHSFAKPPAEIFHSADWTKFGREMGIDLRSLPMHFLILSKRPFVSPFAQRVIGSPRVYKGFAKVLVCSENGSFAEETIKKNDDKDFFKALEKGKFAYDK